MSIDEHISSDEHISKDLAIVARLSRERPISIDTTLRKVGALRDPAEAARAVMPLALLALSRVYVQRFARTIAGGTLIEMTIALLIYVSVPRSSMADFGHDIWHELFYSSKFWLAAFVLLIVLATHVIAARVAARKFEREVGAAGDMLVAARRLVQRADGWAIGASIAGVTSFVVFFGLMFVTLGRWGMVSLFEPHDDPVVFPAVAASLVLSGCAIVVSSLGAIWVARARRGDPRLCIAVGIALGLVSVVAGMRFDVGPLSVTMLANAAPSLALRTVLTITGTLAVFLVVMGIVLHRRAHEENELAR